MTNDKGLTLIEMVVTFIIIAVMGIIVVPTYFTYIQQGAAKAAQNNLITIYNAQKNNYFNKGSYCTATASTASSYCNTQLNDSDCGDTLAAINCNLNLGITDSNFNYTCNSTSGFTCVATSVSAASFTFTLSNSSIVAPGGANCSPPSTVSGCNPVCSYAAHSNYCPSTGN